MASTFGTDAAAPVAESGAETRRSAAADLREIAGDLVQFRELLLQITLRDIRIRYKQAVMGIGWAVLTPLVVVLSGWVVRAAFARLSGGSASHVDMAAIAVRSLLWAFFVGALGFGTASITNNLPLVTKVYFPREVLPLASVLTQLVDLGIGAVVLAIALPFLDVGLSPSLLWLPLLLLLLTLLTTAAAFILSCANVFFRDAKHLVQVILSFGIFFTPVFFGADAFGPTGARVLMLNPLAPLLEGARLAVVQGHDLLSPLATAHGALAWSPWYLAYAAVWAVGGMVASAIIFHRAEFVFAEYV
ncbi:MAG TPA: ABC transporter permease [Gemmatimonadaceae bacterium]|nr:ABC transporter permease [Gemmatimonadaceae bacterium]